MAPRRQLIQITLTTLAMFWFCTACEGRHIDWSKRSDYWNTPGYDPNAPIEVKPTNLYLQINNLNCDKDINSCAIFWSLNSDKEVVYLESDRVYAGSYKKGPAGRAERNAQNGESVIVFEQDYQDVIRKKVGIENATLKFTLANRPIEVDVFDFVSGQWILWAKGSRTVLKTEFLGESAITTVGAAEVMSNQKTNESYTRCDGWSSAGLKGFLYSFDYTKFSMPGASLFRTEKGLIASSCFGRSDGSIGMHYFDSNSNNYITTDARVREVK